MILQGYISCAAGVAYERECPSNLYFDDVSSGCLDKEFVEACGGRATTTQKATTHAPDDSGWSRVTKHDKTTVQYLLFNVLSISLFNVLYDNPTNYHEYLPRIRISHKSCKPFQWTLGHVSAVTTATTTDRKAPVPVTTSLALVVSRTPGSALAICSSTLHRVVV